MESVDTKFKEGVERLSGGREPLEEFGRREGELKAGVRVKQRE